MHSGLRRQRHFSPAVKIVPQLLCIASVFRYNERTSTFLALFWVKPIYLGAYRDFLIFKTRFGILRKVILIKMLKVLKKSSFGAHDRYVLVKSHLGARKIYVLCIALDGLKAWTYGAVFPVGNQHQMAFPRT